MANLDGIYVGYFTGLSGNTVVLFMFKDGNIAGADMGGGIYDGAYTISKDQDFMEGNVCISVPTGSPLIVGAGSGMPSRMEVPIRLPVDIANGDVQKIETPAGALNARFQKIRTL